MGARELDGGWGGNEKSSCTGWYLNPSFFHPFSDMKVERICQLCSHIFHFSFND